MNEIVRTTSPAMTLADMAYEILKTAARPMPTPVVGNRIRVVYGVSGLTEQALMKEVAADSRLAPFGSGHLVLSEWNGRLV